VEYLKNPEDRYLMAGELVHLISVTVRTLQSDGQADLFNSKSEKRNKILAKRERDLNLRNSTSETRCNNMENEEERQFTIGELARLVGVTVRTLQYYDQADLLNSAYTEGGKRIYTRDDVLKLQQILFLKSLGFSLEEINDKILKQGNSADFEKVFTQQREILLGQIANLNKIVDTLDSVIAETKDGKEISMDRLMTIMKLMKQGNPYSFVVRYFNDEQLKNVANQLFDPPEKFEILAKEVFTQLDSLYRQGADPAGKEGQELAKRWWNMVNEFTSGDLGMLGTLISAGKDIGNWPEETKNMRESIENFLEKALNIYLHNNGIQITDTKE
jgi:DNA-binding transcriptional MerR regulator